MKVLKNPLSKYDFKQQLQQTCYESIWSRSVCHPSCNVLVPASRFFFYFYLVQSHFVVFQPFPSHILCLWLSLDFSQTDKLISFIHTWSFSLSSPRLDFFFFPSDIPLPSSWLAVELCFMKTVKTWKAGARWRWGGGGGSASKQLGLSFAFLLSLWKPGIGAWHPISS